jgi:hypothetical protein
MCNLLSHLCFQKRNCATKTFTVLEWLIELWTISDEECLNRKLWQVFIHCNCLTELLFYANEEICHSKGMTYGSSIHFIDRLHSSISIINQSFTFLNHFFNKWVKLVLWYYSSALVAGFPRQKALEIISISWSLIHQWACYFHD